MILQKTTMDHSQDGLHSALGISKSTVVLCRERIFFCHFANTLQSIDLFGDRDDAPRELTTVTGDMQRTLQMITDPLEYEVTLLHFLAFHRMAQEAFSHWKFHNDPDNSSEDKLKLELLKLVSKLKDLRDKAEDEQDEDPSDNNVHADLNIDSVVDRIDMVKKSKYNFGRYLQLLGISTKPNHDDVDRMINGLFD